MRESLRGWEDDVGPGRKFLHQIFSTGVAHELYIVSCLLTPVGHDLGHDARLVGGENAGKRPVAGGLDDDIDDDDAKLVRAIPRLPPATL